jgi:hypothetical protein
MRSRLAVSTLVIASLFGATSIASAQSQTQPAPGASSEGNVGPGATNSKMKSGTTGANTGMTNGAAGSKASRNPSSEGNVGPGTDNNSGKSPGGR